MEATTGWRFVAEELERVGAGVHLAEPAETSGLRGSEEARRRPTGLTPAICGSFLLIGRLPESWIPPDHILDLARPGPLPSYALASAHRVAATDPVGALSPRLPAASRHLMTGEGREWLAAQPLPAAAREQVTVAVAMIDALDVQLAPLTAQLCELRAQADRLQGADRRALRDRRADRGHDPRRARRHPPV